MKRKIKKTLLVSASLIFLVLLIVNTSNVSAEVNITSIDYPEAVEVGEPIYVTVHFEYTDSHSFFLHGPTADLFYSINSLNIDEDAFYVTTPVDSGSRPPSLVFAIPTSALEDGDVIRFEIRYTVVEQNVAIEDRVSNIYRIDIGESEQVTTDETTTNGERPKTNIPMSILIAIGVILSLIVVVVIVNVVKKKINVKR